MLLVHPRLTTEWKCAEPSPIAPRLSTRSGVSVKAGQAVSGQTSRSTPPPPFPPPNFLMQGVQLTPPESAKPLEPAVAFLKRRRVDGVDPARPLDTDAGEPAFAQHLQVLRHRGLRDAELSLNRIDDTASRTLARREQLQNASANGIA